MKRGLIIVVAGVLAAWVCCSAWAQAPTLSLKDSLPVAEKALTDAKVDLAGYYLYSITYAHSGAGNYWYYTYRPNKPSEYREIFVKVYMDGRAEMTGGAQKGY